MLLCIKQTNLFKRNTTATYNIYLYNSACIKIIFFKNRLNYKRTLISSYLQSI